MIIMLSCGVLLVAGVVAAIKWSGLTVTTPAQWQRTESPSIGELVRRYLWWLNVGAVAWLVPGILVAGAGGRLIMRLLAVTSQDSRGLITEAGETVGKISLNGTIGFIIFGGLVAGLLSSTLYLLIRWWLPAGRVGALTFGTLLLLLASTRIEPLRADNPDFVLVGPPWLAVSTFAGLALVHGMATAGIAGRVGRGLPLLSRNPSTLLRYSPLLLLVAVPPLAVVAIVAGVAFVALSNLAPISSWWSARVRLAGRVVAGLASLVALPGFVVALGDVIAIP